MEQKKKWWALKWKTNKKKQIKINNTHISSVCIDQGGRNIKKNRMNHLGHYYELFEGLEEKFIYYLFEYDLWQPINGCLSHLVTLFHTIKLLQFTNPEGGIFFKKKLQNTKKWKKKIKK